MLSIDYPIRFVIVHLIKSFHFISFCEFFNLFKFFELLKVIKFYFQGFSSSRLTRTRGMVCFGILPMDCHLPHTTHITDVWRRVETMQLPEQRFLLVILPKRLDTPTLSALQPVSGKSPDEFERHLGINCGKRLVSPYVAFVLSHLSSESGAQWRIP